MWRAARIQVIHQLVLGNTVASMDIVAVYAEWLLRRGRLRELLDRLNRVLRLIRVAWIPSPGRRRGAHGSCTGLDRDLEALKEAHHPNVQRRMMIRVVHAHK